MGAMILFIFYGSILFFILATAFRVRRCISAPVHLHWELYKGSSIYELTEWWAKTHGTFVEKLWPMILDILFLREFYHRNRKFWYFLYPFHIGIYLLILWHGWLLVSALTTPVESAPIGYLVWSHLATALTFIGGVGIFIKRIVDEDLRVYYPPIHYLKWMFLLITLLGGFYAVHFYFEERMPTDAMKLSLYAESAPALHVLFASVWLVYLPFSHVFQLFFRYYHYLRWDDVPNLRGSKIERRAKEHLERPVTWSAPHIPSGKRWREVASELQQTPATGPK
jgi:nitrate reductase gamma subunit